MIPVFSLAHCHREIRSELLEAMCQVLDGGMFLHGPHVSAFEAELASYCGVAHCRTVASGTDALFLALSALGIGAGDDVLVPAQTFVASALAVSRTGAKPVFVDIDERTWTLSPERAEIAVTSRTRAILAVHLYGQPCDMRGLNNVAQRHGLAIVEDNAQAQGAQWESRSTGSLGQIAAHSFYPTKNLGCCGDGGAITTDDATLAERVALLANYGCRQRFQSVEQGTNSRLDELQAAILRVKLRCLDRWNQERVRLVALYRQHLSDLPEIHWQRAIPESVPIPHLLVARVPDRAGLRQHLKRREIGTDIHYPIPVPHQQVYRNDVRFDDFPVATQLARECLTLPLFPGLKDEEVRQVCEGIREFFCRTTRTGNLDSFCLAAPANVCETVCKEVRHPRGGGDPAKGESAFKPAEITRKSKVPG